MNHLTDEQWARDLFSPLQVLVEVRGADGQILGSGRLPDGDDVLDLCDLDPTGLAVIGERRAEFAHERVVLRAVGDEESVHSCPKALASTSGFRAGTGQLQGADRSEHRVVYRRMARLITRRPTFPVPTDAEC